MAELGEFFPGFLGNHGQFDLVLLFPGFNDFPTFLDYQNRHGKLFPFRYP
jgi:hypothetical protein